MIVPPVACKTPALDQGEAGQLESLRRTATVQVSHFHDTMLKSWIELIKPLKIFHTGEERYLHLLFRLQIVIQSV